MRHLLFFGLSFLLFGCNFYKAENKEEQENTLQSKQSVFVIVDTIDYSMSDTTTNKNSHPLSDLNFPCSNNSEVAYYKKVGDIIQTPPNHIVCALATDTINAKLLFEDCKMVYRSIRNVKTGAYSFAKYYEGKITLYDSIGANQETIISYDRFLNRVVYNGVHHTPGIEFLPKYIQEELSDKKQK